MNSPKISIVTPSYNQGEFLEQTITSVLSQGYPNLEYVIIDGGSTDNSVEIIKKYEKHLAYWISEKDKGQSDAINKGLKIVSGEIFNWLNSDDYYLPNVFLRLAELFSDEKINVVGGKSSVFDQKGKKFIADGTFVDKMNFQNTLNHCHIEQPATFFRKSAIDKMGLLSLKLNYVMDKEWWLKYLYHFGTESVLRTDDVFANFRLHDDSKTMRGDFKFYSDYATLLYSLASKKGLTDTAELLEMKYSIDTTYKFECSAFEKIGAKTVEKMLVYFLLKRASLIFDKKDFIHAKKLLAKIDFSKFIFSPDEKNWLAKTQKLSSVSSWTMFRINRKLNHIFK